MSITPFYDPKKSYYENWDEGPFGAFANGEVFYDAGEPTYSLFGHKVFLPLGIPAGPLLNGAFVKASLDKGFDIPIHKTVRTRQWKSHPWPNVLPVKIEGDLTIEKSKERLVTGVDYKEPLSITNSFGNPSFDPDVWQKDLMDSISYAKKGQIVGASFEGTRWEGYSDKDYINDWVMSARLLKETGIHFIEANLSCPNQGTTSLLCYNTDRVRIIAVAIKNEIGNFPLVLKISYFARPKLSASAGFTPPELLHDFVKSLGNIVDGIAAINTISAEVVDSNGNQALPGEGRLRSGVCGHSIKWAGIDMVKRLKELREELGLKYVIIGVGGMMNLQDFKEYRDAGADAVMTATGAMWNPYLARKIKEKFNSRA